MIHRKRKGKKERKKDRKRELFSSDGPRPRGGPRKGASGERAKMVQCVDGLLHLDVRYTGHDTLDWGGRGK